MTTRRWALIPTSKSGDRILTAAVLQRFVLAEIIKASQLDVEALASFVRSRQVNFDFMSMQLPQGKH